VSNFLTLALKVVIAGNDVTSRFRPRLLSISISKASKRSAHTCEMTLADVDGGLLLPSDGDEVQVSLGQSGFAAGLAFTGAVNNVESSGGRGGRRLSINAASSDQKSKVKQPVLRHKDKGKFQDTAKEWGKKAGLDVTVIGELADVERDYWSMQHESFQQWGQRIAEELGATFQIVGKRAAFAPRNDGKSASGKPLTPITAAWGSGGNLLQWKISSADSRPQFKEVKARYFDRKTGQWKQSSAEIESSGSEALLNIQIPYADEKSAKAKASSSARESKRSKGGGSITIIGNASAEPEATCTVSGARPGIDGEYIIDQVEHSVSRSDGWETKLTLKLPSGSAGKDSRAKR